MPEQRCTAPGCGGKLVIEEIHGTALYCRLECPRCKQYVIVTHNHVPDQCPECQARPGALIPRRGKKDTHPLMRA